MKKIALLVYCFLFLGICLLFSAGLLLTENRPDTADFPALFTEDGLSDRFSTDLETWFSKNFAFSGRISDTYAALKYTVFSEGNDQVIIGNEDFHFFQDTVPDYIGTSALTDEEIEELAASLLWFQQQAEESGAAFLFVCAPNKNTIYADRMPSRYIRSTEPTNMDRLFAALDTLSVDYVDLRPVLLEKAETELVYHKRDTHWNGIGAQAGIEAILGRLNHPMPDLTGRGPYAVSDFEGDLSALLYQDKVVYDQDMTYDFTDLYVFTSAYSTPMDVTITTRSAGEGRLLLFRDSFANAWIPYLACAFGETHMERIVPYRHGYIANYKPDVVIIEIAERNLPVLAGQIDTGT